MSLFQRLADAFNPKPQSDHILGLSDKDLRNLSILARSEEWPVYQKALDARVNLYAEKLLAASDAFTLARLQGTLIGLRLAGTLVDEALQHERHANSQRSRTTGPADRFSADRRQLATYGTAAWSAANSK